jgi:molecular chaperone HtpG
VLPEGGSPAFLERLLREHGRDMPRARRILEVNPAHPVIEHLRKLHEKDAKSERVAEWIELLHDQALLTEGSALEDPNRFAKRMTALLTQLAAQAVESPGNGAPAASTQAPEAPGTPGSTAQV